MCSDAIKPPNQQLHYKNAFDGLLTISRTEGPRQLYRGAGTVMMRSMTLNGSQLASYVQAGPVLSRREKWLADLHSSRRVDTT